jgi:ubiquinone/menaquinone biosynthesis C-methylase UbiE
MLESSSCIPGMKSCQKSIPPLKNSNHGYPAGLALRGGTKTLEVGAGLGEHATFEDLSKQDYYSLEYREEFCKELRKKMAPGKVVCGDNQVRQPWDDAAFDRVIAIHVLEYLRDLPAALKEIQRLMKSDAVFDVVIPTEGGLAYSLARKISASGQSFEW